jgi:hypothetical protein
MLLSALQPVLQEAVGLLASTAQYRPPVSPRQGQPAKPYDGPAEVMTGQLWTGGRDLTFCCLRVLGGTAWFQ